MKCGKCGKDIDDNVKYCQYCGNKIQKGNNKEVRIIIGILIIIVSLYFFIDGINGINSKEISEVNNISNKTVKVEKAKVNVIDFSHMSKEEIKNWCNENKIGCTITEKYSNNVAKGKFISQSVQANNTIYEGEKITIIYSLGKEPTTEQKNALKQAENYSKIMHMSKAAIYDQLISEYGEGFTIEAAQYAIDNIVADWNANALAQAKNYQTTMNMSKKNIYNQLISEYGEKFTKEEAQYAIDHLED